MAQHDMNIANQGFPATRADLNNALQALASNSSGTSAPSTTFANQWWYDTTNNKLYIRNEANNAWIQVAVLDQTNNEWQITTGQISAADGDGLVFKTDDGNTRITLSDGGDVTFADGTDVITASAGTDNVRIGAGAGDSIASGGANNVAIGKNAGTAMTTAKKNTLVGAEAGEALVDGDNNVALGYQALEADRNGEKTVAIGAFALNSQDHSGLTDTLNTAVGYQAGTSVTTGAENTIMGGEAGDALTVGNANVAIGVQALTSDQNGSRSTAVGTTALKLQEASGSTSNNYYNVALGYGAGDNITTGYYNTMLGSFAGHGTDDGIKNVIIGYLACEANCGENNTIVGAEAGQLTTGENNTLIGKSAAAAQTSSSYNVVVGNHAANDMTTNSSANTCIGGFSGDGMTQNAVNNVYVGYNTQTNSAEDDYQIVIGTDMNGVGAEYFTFGNNSKGRVYNQFSSNASWTRTSDERMKKDIEANTDCGLAFINDLRTVTYKWKAPSEHPEEFKSYDADITEASYTEKMYGFIAQEVKAAIDTHNITGFNGWHVTPESQGSQQGISYEMFVMPLVKAVQELSAKVDALETENTAIKARLDALEAE